MTTTAFRPIAGGAHLRQQRRMNLTQCSARTGCERHLRHSSRKKRPLPTRDRLRKANVVFLHMENSHDTATKRAFSRQPCQNTTAHQRGESRWPHPGGAAQRSGNAKGQRRRTSQAGCDVRAFDRPAPSSVTRLSMQHLQADAVHPARESPTQNTAWGLPPD